MRKLILTTMLTLTALAICLMTNAPPIFAQGTNDSLAITQRSQHFDASKAVSGAEQSVVQLSGQKEQARTRERRTVSANILAGNPTPTPTPLALPANISPQIKEQIILAELEKQTNRANAAETRNGELTKDRTDLQSDRDSWKNLYLGEQAASGKLAAANIDLTKANNALQSQRSMDKDLITSQDRKIRTLKFEKYIYGLGGFTAGVFTGFSLKSSGVADQFLQRNSAEASYSRLYENLNMRQLQIGKNLQINNAVPSNLRDILKIK